MSITSRWRAQRMGPVGTMASANCAAAIQDFTGHEWTFGLFGAPENWERHRRLRRQMVKDGHIQLPDKPGLESNSTRNTS